MKKVKGLVLESTAERVFLLTPEGEYLEVPGSGEVFDTGAEIELELPQERKRNRFSPAFAAAAAILILAFSLVIHLALGRPEAYLALDINPSLYFSLDRKGHVIEAEPLNGDAQEILKGLRLQGKNIREALTLILDDAYAGDYLSAERENVILISLAAPESFVISEDDLRVLVSERVLGMELDTYLKVMTLEPQQAVEAREKNLPVNALVLGEQMVEKGLIEEEDALPLEDESSPEQGPFVQGQSPRKKESGPPAAVRELLRRVRPEEIFEPEEYIRGKGPAGKRPDRVEPQAEVPPANEMQGGTPQQSQGGTPQQSQGGPPGKVGSQGGPPVQTGSKNEPSEHTGPEGETPGRTDTGPPEGTPPGQVGRDPGDKGKGNSTPGKERDRDKEQEEFVPPGRDKDAFVPSGKDKGKEIPPGPVWNS